MLQSLEFLIDQQVVSSKLLVLRRKTHVHWTLCADVVWHTVFPPMEAPGLY